MRTKCSKRILKLRTFGDISDVYKPPTTKILQAATSFLHFGLIHWPQRKHLGTCRKKTLKEEDSYPFSHRGSGKLPQNERKLTILEIHTPFFTSKMGGSGDFQLPLRDFSATKRHVRFQGLLLSGDSSPRRQLLSHGVSQLSCVKLNLEDPNFKDANLIVPSKSYFFGDQWFYLVLAFNVPDYVKKPVILEKNHPQLQPCSLRCPSSKRFPCWVT